MCHTQELWLSNNKIGDAGLTAFAKAVESGALASLEKLVLNDNGIGDEGMSALAKAITPDKDGKGALASLEDLRLQRNQIGDDGLKALADACASGALAQLTRLELDRNRIGDAGLTALAEAIKPTADNASGALDKLTVCWRAIALLPCPETSHMHSPNSYLLFDVTYAGTLAQSQQDRGRRPYRSR